MSPPLLTPIKQSTYTQGPMIIVLNFLDHKLVQPSLIPLSYNMKLSPNKPHRKPSDTDVSDRPISLCHRETENWSMGDLSGKICS